MARHSDAACMAKTACGKPGRIQTFSCTSLAAVTLRYVPTHTVYLSRTCARTHFASAPVTCSIPCVHSMLTIVDNRNSALRAATDARPILTRRMLPAGRHAVVKRDDGVEKSALISPFWGDLRASTHSETGRRTSCVLACDLRLAKGVARK